MLKILISLLLIHLVSGIDVCSIQVCKCDRNEVSCENKGWLNLTGFDFPPGTTKLNLAKNQLKFDQSEDRIKIEQLASLHELNLDDNPLGVIPPFNLSQIQTLSLDGTSLSSAKVPPIYNNSLALKKLSLSRNRLRTINENDFQSLAKARLVLLKIEDAALETIDAKAFLPLARLQSLSLNKNLLKSLDFISNLHVLASVKLDENQFSSLPDQLVLPNNVKTFSFKRNLITTIDDRSPLSVWQKKNLTNIKIFLANNSFDCCQSQWFIQLLKTTPFVDDASLLTCAKPAELFGKALVSLNPDDIHCGTVVPKKLWLVITLSVVGSVVLLLTVVGLVLLVLRRNRARVGYTEIGGVDDPMPNGGPIIARGPVFPRYGDDDDEDDHFSDRQTVVSSVAPTIVDQL